MKTRLLLLLLLPAVLAAHTKWEQNPNGPVITFDTCIYHFDTVVSGTIIECEFRFTNTGKEPLIISEAVAPDGATCPVYTKEPIAPGRSSVIKVRSNTTGKHGHMDKTISVHSNAINNEGLTVLHLQGYIEFQEVQISFDSRSFSFDTVGSDTTIRHVFTFRNISSQPLIIQNVAPWEPDWSREPIPPGASGSITVTFCAVGKHGPIDKVVHVFTNAENFDSIVELHVTGFVK